MRTTMAGLSTLFSARSPRAQAWLLWLVVSVLVLVANRDLLSTPYFAEGDYGANELSIERAKQFNEILGNYSRFQFNHPGPAFFYCYAAGEAVFFDALKIVPTAFNSHLLASILLQAGFFALAVSIIAGHTERPGRTMAALGATGLLHFSFVPYAFYDDWPPFVLMIPLACFIVACSSVFIGKKEDLPWLFLTGCFLVHGHVAQPLFVVPLSLLAGLGLWHQLRSGRKEAGRGLGRNLVICAAIVAVFLIPMILDLRQGWNSNLARILTHLMKGSPEGRPEFWSAVTYTFSYFGYFIGQDDIWAPDAALPLSRFWQSHGPILTLWIPVLLTGVVGLWRKRNQNPRASGRLARSLGLFWLLSMGLAIVWATKQNKGLQYFNSYFVFGLAFVLLLAVATAWEFWVVKLERRLLWVIGAALACFCVVKIESLPHRSHMNAYSVEQSMELLLSKDPRPKAPKLLLFQGGEVWVDAVSVACSLQRRGIPFRVAPEWGFMFGQEHVLRGKSGGGNPDDYSIWQILPETYHADPAWRIAEYGRVRFLQPSALGAMPQVIDFSEGGNSFSYATFGICPPEEDFCWTCGPIAVLRWTSAPVERDVRLTMEATPFLGRPLTPQPVTFMLGGTKIGSFTICDREIVSMVIPAKVWNQAASQGFVGLSLEIPGARAPASCADSTDWRELGLKLHSISLALEPPSAGIR